ncbi:MAG: hypothetical protein GYA59_16225 [Chloroflexi bacterium]|nr:hypothetical protein [Chloroflexota bacterium]
MYIFAARLVYFYYDGVAFPVGCAVQVGRYRLFFAESLLGRWNHAR